MSLRVHLASHPPRKEGMLKRVKEILPQLKKGDIFQLYLNNYNKSILEELPKDNRLEIILAGICGHDNRSAKYPDLKSFGKLFNIDKCEDYLLTIDDDINYPKGYIDYMIDGCKKYEDRCIVTLHGGMFEGIVNGRLPNVPARECRTLYPYDTGRDSDMQVHTNGMGITCFHPKKLGMKQSDILNCNWESGDDEEVNLYAQRNEIPIIRLAGSHNWVTPDPTVHVINPLYANNMAVCLASEKIKNWTKWHKPQMIGPRMPREGAGLMDLFHTTLDDNQKSIVKKIISPESLAAIIVDKIRRKESLSVVRVSDGERYFIKHSQGIPLPNIITNPQWQQKYGVMGADHIKIGSELLDEGMKADYLCPSISGIYNGEFNCWEFFKDRECFADWAFPALLLKLDRIAPIVVASQQVLVLHSRANEICDKLSKKYPVIFIPIEFNSWKDQTEAYTKIKRNKAQLVLVAGGPSAKPWMVKVARECNKVVLDIGQALEDQWA